MRVATAAVSSIQDAIAAPWVGCRTSPCSSWLAASVKKTARILDLSSLRVLVNCSEPVRAQSIDEFIAAYQSCGLHRTALASSYAMAENVFAVTQSDITSAPSRLWVDATELLRRNVAVPSPEGRGVCLVSSGRCLPGNEVRIVSADGRDLADYEIGEIVIRSDSLFEGYFNRPDLPSRSRRKVGIGQEISVFA